MRLAREGPKMLSTAIVAALEILIVGASAGAGEKSETAPSDHAEVFRAVVRKARAVWLNECTYNTLLI